MGCIFWSLEVWGELPKTSIQRTGKVESKADECLFSFGAVPVSWWRVCWRCITRAVKATGRKVLYLVLRENHKKERMQATTENRGQRAHSLVHSLVYVLLF